jgi:hypothetical protein
MGIIIWCLFPSAYSIFVLGCRYLFTVACNIHHNLVPFHVNAVSICLQVFILSYAEFAFLYRVCEIAQGLSEIVFRRLRFEFLTAVSVKI